MTDRPIREAARLIVLDDADRLLLFRFTAAGRQPFWATAGGAVDPGETFEEAARRELLEETGIDADPGAEVARRESDFTTLHGADVRAVERYFVVRVSGEAALDFSGHTDDERVWMLSHRWWSLDELARMTETVFPADIAALVAEILETPRE